MGEMEGVELTYKSRLRNGMEQINLDEKRSGSVP